MTINDIITALNQLLDDESVPVTAEDKVYLFEEGPAYVLSVYFDPILKRVRIDGE